MILVGMKSVGKPDLSMLNDSGYQMQSSAKTSRANGLGGPGKGLLSANPVTGQRPAGAGKSFLDKLLRR